MIAALLINFSAIAQKPTPTPRPIPPPADPIGLNIMILMGVVILAIILGGYWFNRWRLK
jgi:hypothetical protein